MATGPGPRLSHGVAARLATLTLSGGGRLRRTVYVDQAIRGALLIDLATAGRIALNDDEVEIDTTPVGYGPADSLLAEMATLSDRTLDGWIVRGTPSLPTMVRELVTSSLWQRRRAGLGSAYTCLDPGLLMGITSFPVTFSDPAFGGATGPSEMVDIEDCALIAENLARKVNLRRELESFDPDPESTTAWLENSVLDLLTETLAAAPGELLTFGAGM